MSRINYFLKLDKLFYQKFSISNYIKIGEILTLQKLAARQFTEKKSIIEFKDQIAKVNANNNNNNDKIKALNGIFYIENGDKYEGEYTKGPNNNELRHGNGTYYYVNGDKYVGEFKSNLFDGNGTYYYNANDSEFKGDKYVR